MGISALHWLRQKAGHIAVVHTSKKGAECEAWDSIQRERTSDKCRERAEYDEGVDVYFQECAWMDHDVNMKWVSKTLIPGIGNSSDEKVISADNVGFQLNKEFHEACRKKANAVVYLLLENHTDKVQPIDTGCGKLLKTKIGEAMERWLEEDDNLELWHDKISAKQRRVLMTK